MKRFTKLIVSVFLFAAFPFIDLLSSPASSNVIGSTATQWFAQYKILLYAANVLVFIAFRLYVDRARPVTKSDIEHLKPVVDYLLELTIADYTSIVSGDDDIVRIRINIMLITRHSSWWKLLPRKHLRIYYSFTFSDVRETDEGIELVETSFGYSHGELALKWYSGQGVCGKAWADNACRLYDSEDPKYKEAINLLTAEQKRQTGNLRSVLSVPITVDKKIIGIANVDSEQNISTTHFESEEIVQCVRKLTDSLSIVLEGFVDGVSDGGT